MVNEIIVDTSALIEYVFATEKGKVAKHFIENPENTILIPSVVIGELVSKLGRSGVMNVDEIVNDLTEYSVTLSLESETCHKAGKKHVELRKYKETENISLVDCIVMELAEEHGNALILAKDGHFKAYKNVKLL